MALNTLKYSLKSQFTSIANSGIRASFDKLRDIVSDSFDNASSSKNGEVNGVANFGEKTPIYSFPLDVASDPKNPMGNHGHYILFYINKQEPAKLNFGEEGESAFSDGTQAVVEQARQVSVPEYIRELDPTGVSEYVGRRYDEGLGDILNEDFKRGTILLGGGGVMAGTVDRSDIVKAVKDKGFDVGKSMVRVKRAPTTRLETAIAMYMPPSVNVSYAANYVDTEIGAFSVGAGAAIREFNRTGKLAAGATAFLDTVPDELKNVAARQILGAIGSIIPGTQGLEEVAGMATGQIIADRMELAFKGLPKRGFQYTFKMIPKSEQEAEEIRKIVFTFKANMLPEVREGTAGRGMVVPNTFDIRYMYMNRDNDFLHKISTCVLESMNVTYGGDRYRTFPDAGDGTPPVETTMTLNFKELELITKERVYEGF